MARSHSYKIVSFICLHLFLLPLVSASSTLSLPQLGEKHQSELFAITSQNDALRLFKKSLRSDLELPQKRGHHTRSAFGKQRTRDMQENILAFVTHVLASRLALSIQTTLQQENREKIPRFLDDTMPGYQWAQTKSLAPAISRMLSFNRHLSEYITQIPVLSKRPQGFSAFARYVDQQYPELIGSNESWVGLLEQGSVSALSERLSQYWDLETTRSQLSNTISCQSHQTKVNEFARYYIWTRLWPIFKTHLTALTMQAESEALQIARQSLTRLRNQNNTQSATRDASRICGTWHWTVHNHQNHGDHKMTIALGEKTQQHMTQPQPTEIKVNGDTVYLFWKFPRGYQEDSLLLSNNDKRLEGTFVNSLGPYGSIMGKRISFCNRKRSK